LGEGIAGRENLSEPEAESKSWAGEKTPVKMGDILTAVSTIHQRSAGRGSGQARGFDPEKCQKKIFAPLPAVLLAGLSTVFLAGLLTKLLRVETPLF